MASTEAVAKDAARPNHEELEVGALGVAVPVVEDDWQEINVHGSAGRAAMSHPLLRDGRVCRAAVPSPSRRPSRLRTFITQGTPAQKVRELGKDDWTSRPPLCPINLNLLYLSKSVREDALSTINAEMVKVFRTPTKDLPVGCAKTTIFNIPDYVPVRFQTYLNHIQLALDNVDLVLLFNVPLPGIKHDGGAYFGGAVLRDLPNLQSLEIYFQSTARKSYNPWWTYRRVEREEREDLQAQGMVFDRAACQKKLQEWILAHAYQYIKKIDKVKLTGFIKTETRKKWMKILNPKGLEDYNHVVEEELVMLFRAAVSQL